MIPAAPRISIVASTYNWPEALKLCMQSIARQSLLPCELIVADDGSGEPTRREVERFVPAAPFPVRHVWHEDEGFRVAAIRNKAIAAAAGDYIVLIDGDILLHPKFVEDHSRFAEQGYFAAGSRVDLPAGYTARILACGRYSYRGLAGPALGSPLKGLRFPVLAARMLDRHADNPFSGRGCNLAAWRGDLLAVNGFDEDYVGWGREDTDLICRLMKFGLRKHTLRMCAVSYHLHHSTRTDDGDLSRNDSLLREALGRQSFRCTNGIVRDTSPKQ